MSGPRSHTCRWHAWKFTWLSSSIYSGAFFAWVCAVIYTTGNSVYRLFCNKATQAFRITLPRFTNDFTDPINSHRSTARGTVRAGKGLLTRSSSLMQPNPNVQTDLFAPLVLILFLPPPYFHLLGTRYILKKGQAQTLPCPRFSSFDLKRVAFFITAAFPLASILWLAFTPFSPSPDQIFDGKLFTNASSTKLWSSGHNQADQSTPYDVSCPPSLVSTNPSVFLTPNLIVSRSERIFIISILVFFVRVRENTWLPQVETSFWDGITSGLSSFCSALPLPRPNVFVDVIAHHKKLLLPDNVSGTSRTNARNGNEQTKRKNEKKKPKQST